MYPTVYSVSNYTNVRRCAFKGRRECAAVSIVVHRFRTGSPYRKTVSAVHLLLSPSHESSSDVYDFRVCSPTLQRVLDESGTSLNDCSCKIAESVGPFSAVDVYNMQPCMFTSISSGVLVIDLAKRVVNPDGWTRVDQTLSSGRVIPHFYGPDGQYSRSLVVQ